MLTELEIAIAIAVKAHQGQVDRAGKPYILHPLRVMLGVESDLERTAAILHDVVEDTAMTPADLRQQGISEEAVALVDCLTKRVGEDYEVYLERVLANRAACRIKLADLRDNMDVKRVDQLAPKDLERLNRYLKAWPRVSARANDTEV